MWPTNMTSCTSPTLLTATAGSTPERSRNRTFSATVPTAVGASSPEKPTAYCASVARHRLSRAVTNPTHVIPAAR